MNRLGLSGPSVLGTASARRASARSCCPGRSTQHEISETRAALESTTTAGGDLVAPTSADDVLRLVKELDGVIADVEDVPTDNGAPWGRPVVSAFSTAPAVAEGVQVVDSTSTAVTLNAVQQFGDTPTYVARLSASLQLVQDANVDVQTLFASAAAEDICRQVATIGGSAIYAAASSKTALTTLTASGLAKLIAGVDPGLLPGAKFYMSSIDALNTSA